MNRAGILPLLVAVSLTATSCSLERDVGSDARSGPRVGSPAPVLRAETLDGRGTDLAAERGHPVVVDFFAAWCGPCVAQQPTLDALARAYGPRGVVFLGVDVRESAADTAAYLRTHDVPYPAIHDGDGSIAAAFEVLAPPTTVVVDGSGRIAATFLGGVTGDALGAVLERVLRR